jgi:group II intron reverse transcriptase/maturase
MIPTRLIERGEGERAVPVNEQTRQLGLRFGTAEETVSKDAVADDEAELPRRKPATLAAPKPKRKDKKITSATMEEVCEGLEEAFQKVASNKGAPGPDRQSIEEVREHLIELLPQLRTSLLEGSYEPGNIRRVWIPKSGGHRGLGIPNVVDRMVQEAVRQVLEPLYEPTFHDESHGFRPGRSCHTAIAQARKHIEDGYGIVVDLDLANFFDRVSHQRLMSRLSQRVKDRRLLVLIGRMLKAKVVMPDGVVVRTEEGVPQGGPLSPLLSNIVLDELDCELKRRGHRFVRYADDCNAYVRSESAGQRVMASLVRFIEKRLRLKVNTAKSAVAHPEERHFLGFSLRRDPLEGDVEVMLSSRSQERVRTKIRELLPRTWGDSLRECITQLNGYLEGWINFFGICTKGIERTLQQLDAHIRRRLRAIQLKHWKKKRTIARKLIALGIRAATAWRRVYEGRQSFWAWSHSPAVDRALCNAYFAERGLVSLLERWRTKNENIIAPVTSEQLMLSLGPGIGEVVNRPAAGVATRRPDEPCVKGTCTVL